MTTRKAAATTTTIAIKGGVKSTAGEFDGGGKKDLWRIGVGVRDGDGAQ